MRMVPVVVAIAAAVIAPMAFAQSAQGSDSPRPAAQADPASHEVVPVSKAHQAMASFNSLLREAALQAQAAQRTSASTQSAQPSAPDSRGELASTPDPDSVH